ncbi:MAG: hypothetical protein AB8B99_04145 [Phormidesmis sp.]
MVDSVESGKEYDELQAQYALLTEEIQFLQNSDRIDDLSPRERFRLKKQIESVEEERAALKQQLQALEESSAESTSSDLYPTLLRLGYRQQIRLFRRTIESESVMAFLIHGYPEYGQSWLLNRIVVQYVPYFLTGKIIRVHVSRKVRRNDVSALWREVAGRVGLRGKQYTPAEIAQQVVQCLETQNVLLVFHEVEELPEAILNELVKEFWQPLVSAVKAIPASQHQFKLLMFLVDYEGCVGEWEVPFAEKLDAAWEASVLLKAPIITEFSDGDLLDWIEREYDKLPPALTEKVDDNIQAILADTENGIPELVLDVICNYCGCDWYEESKKWLNL